MVHATRDRIVYILRVPEEFFFMCAIFFIHGLRTKCFGEEEKTMHMFLLNINYNNGLKASIQKLKTATTFSLFLYLTERIFAS